MTTLLKRRKKNARREDGFTLIELLLVITIIGIMLSVSVPISFSMYENYKASLSAQEVMIFVSRLQRESFLYSEYKALSAKDGAFTIDDQGKSFQGVAIQMDAPITFYQNGTTSGGVIRVQVGNQIYALRVDTPLGNLTLSRLGAI